eukprot:80268-Rhodomonas_salina.1
MRDAGNSSHEAAFSVKAHDVVLSQGDHAQTDACTCGFRAKQGSITRSEVGALAVEAIFIPAAYNVVLEAGQITTALPCETNREHAAICADAYRHANVDMILRLSWYPRYYAPMRISIRAPVLMRGYGGTSKLCAQSQQAEG